MLKDQEDQRADAQRKNFFITKTNKFVNQDFLQKNER